MKSIKKKIKLKKVEKISLKFIELFPPNLIKKNWHLFTLKDHNGFLLKEKGIIVSCRISNLDSVKKIYPFQIDEINKKEGSVYNFVSFLFNKGNEVALLELLNEVGIGYRVPVPVDFFNKNKEFVYSFLEELRLKFPSSWEKYYERKELIKSFYGVFMTASDLILPIKHLLTEERFILYNCDSFDVLKKQIVFLDENFSIAIDC